MLFAGSENAVWKTESETEEVQGFMAWQLRSCPYSDGSNRGSDEWVESVSLHECGHVPCGCRVAMEIQARQSSHTRPVLEKAGLLNHLIGGLRSLARRVMTPSMAE